MLPGVAIQFRAKCRRALNKHRQIVTFAGEMAADAERDEYSIAAGGVCGGRV
jgi:hypothetical protein